MNETGAKLRADKWLWQARFFKTRSLSASLITGAHLRINGEKVHKASTAVKPGDVLTFPQGDTVRVIQIDALGTRRGPAPEAQALYTDLSPPEPRTAKPGNDAGIITHGRPTKADRRAHDLLKRRTLD